MVWIIDEEEIFKVNDKLGINIEEIGAEKNKVVLIDDFYANPDKVRDFILNSPASKWSTVTYGFPIARTHMTLNLEKVRQAISHITEKVYGLSAEPIPAFISNLTINDQETKENPGKAIDPHVDHCLFAAVAFLNIPEECRGGTAIYRHRETLLESLPHPIPYYENFIKERIFPLAKKYSCKSYEDFLQKIIFSPRETSQCISESDHRWELIKILEMKYNRLVLYEGKLFHSVYFQPNDFIHHYRIVQAMFFPKGVPVKK